MNYLKQAIKMTVQDFLDLPSSKDFQLLAGSDGLQQEISGGNIMDNPNALDWFTPGEVLITSGYFLTADPKVQLKQLKIFKTLNLAAICIKPLTFFDEIPATLLEYCDMLSIPLIEVPYGVTFSGIVTDIMNELTSSVNVEKQLAIDSHTRFFQATLDGGGIDVITQDLASLLDNSTIIVDTDWNILSYSRIDDQEIQYFTSSHESVQFDLSSLDDLPPKVGEIKHIIHRNFNKEESAINLAIMPIFFNTVNYGYIIIVTAFKKLTNTDHIILQSASLALALQISQKTETERNSNRVIRDFFKHLLSGKMMDPNLLKSVGIDVDYNEEYAFVILNIEVLHDTTSPFMQRKQLEINIMKKILEDIRRFTYDTSIELQVFKQGNKVFGIYKKKPTMSPEDNRIEKKAFFHQLLGYINQRNNVPIDINIMIGSYQPLEKLRNSYEEAVRIESFLLDEDQHIFFYDDFFLELFLSEHIDEKAEQEFYEYYLTPLLHYDESNNAELVTTLKEYLSNNYNVADTARKLFIHRNTMLYRLSKIEEILKTNIHAPKTTLALKLAFEFYEKKPLVEHLL